MRERQIRGSSLLLAGVLVAALLGCKTLKRKVEERSSGVSGPVSLTWEQPYKVIVQGTKGEGTFFPTRDPDKPALKLQASFHDLPKGTKVRLGPEETTVGESGYWNTMVDIKPAVLKQPLDELTAPIDLSLELTVEVPGASPSTTKLQKQDVKEGVRAALLKARDGGVTFGAGDEPAKKPRGVAVLSSFSDLQFIGSGKTLSEVDWVVIAENQKEPRATKSCTFKEGKSVLKIFDATTVVIDRRTGERRTEKTLKASAECPMFALIDKTDNSTKNNVSSKDVVAFARAELAKAK